MQNSAVSFSICIDNEKYKFPELLGELTKRFNVFYNDKVMLYTIRHYNDVSIDTLIKGKQILLEQKSRNTVQYIIS